MSGSSQTDVIYTDLSAAFDRINHDIAVAKLEKIGYDGRLLSWFRSYFTGRSLRVCIDGTLSDVFFAYSGVPQGSNFGPLGFLLYYNDAITSIQCPRLAFADDLKIFSRINNVNEAVALQQQLINFSDWCNRNRMVLNPSKCVVVSYYRKTNPVVFNYCLNGETIPRADHFKDLGVILDTKLTFIQHVSMIIAKASRNLGFIFRMTKDFTNIQCLTALYCSLVRSTLEYCSTVWCPFYGNAVDRIEGVQRKFVRYALRRLPWREPMRLTPYIERCLLLHMDTLQLRRDVSRATFVSDVINNHVDCPDIMRQINLRAPTRTLRSGAMLALPLSRTNYSAHGALAGLQRAFNRVSSVFDFNLSRAVIKSRIVSFLRRLLYH